MKIKRIFAVLTLIFAVLGFFAGCEDLNDNKTLEDPNNDKGTPENPASQIPENSAGDFDYILNTNDQGVTITRYVGASRDVGIPAVIDGRPVRNIGDKAFDGTITGFKLTGISIPNSVISIGEYAFANNQLTSVSIGSIVTTIERYAFYNNQLTNVTIPDRVTTIGQYAFSNNRLTSVTITSNEWSGWSGWYAFSDNPPLTSITLGNGILNIGANTFSDNMWVGLTAINVSANHPNYSSVDGVLYDKNGTILIRWPIAKTPVSIPNSVTVIGEYAFARYSGNQLTSVIIPDSVIEIGVSAFFGNQLTSVTIGADVALSGYSSFGSFDDAYNDGGKQAGTYTWSNTGWIRNAISSGDFIYSDSGTAITIVAYTGHGGEESIPASINGKPVTTIGDRAFYKSQLTSVIIPDSVISIGEYAFSDNQLTSVTIGNSVCTIGAYAFANINSYSGNQLTSIIIPDSVTEIGDYAFSNNRLINVTIGNNVRTIGTYAFANINDYSGNQLTSVIIPDSVTEIGDYAFSNNRLINVTIGNNVRTIGAYAFAGSNTIIYDNGNQLTSIIIPDSVTEIGDYAFSNNRLINVTIGNNVRTIGAFAFANMNSYGNGNQLTSIIIPDSVTEIRDHAFFNNRLTSITIGADVTFYVYGGAFDFGFENAYYNGGKQAGTYTRPDTSSTEWTKVQ